MILTIDGLTTVKFLYCTYGISEKYNSKFTLNISIESSVLGATTILNKVGY
jgi:hypothetical protein